MIKKLRSVAVPVLGIVAALLAICLFAAPVAEAADGEKEVAQVVELEGMLSQEELSESVTKGTPVNRTDYTSADSTLKLRDTATTQAARPAKFDLRNATFRGKTGSFVTPVKNQNPFATCWSFGATAAAESAYLSEMGIPVADPATTLNLSEKHLAWFSLTPLKSNGNGQQGEGFSIRANPETESSAIYQGANVYNATWLFASLTGPVDEGIDPSFAYHNAAGEYQPSTADPNEMWPVKTGDWSIDEKWRDYSSMELEESFFLPSPASQDQTPDGAFTYTFNQQGVNAIKDQLLAGRAVTIGFAADQSMPGQTSTGGHYINTDTWAHYTYEVAAPSHEVCIVGYDDAYPASNFNADHQPPANGAFIVKNSWGGTDAIGMDKATWGIDGTGYFYLSYYDQSIYLPEAYDFVTPYDDDLTFGKETGDSTVGQYQYAYMPGEQNSKTYDAVTSAANVYDISEDSVLRDVTSLTVSFDVDVRYDIYLLDEGAKTPTDGELVWSKDVHYPYGGFHRAEVDQPIVVHEGDVVAVVVTTSLPNGKYEVQQNQYYSKLGAEGNAKDVATIVTNPYHDKWGTTVVNEGESFLGQPGTRVDYADGSYDYADYTWTDLSQSLAEAKAKAETALAGVDFSALEAALDEAFPAYEESVNRMLSGQVSLDPTNPDFQKIQADVKAYRDASDAMVAAAKPYVGDRNGDAAAAFYVWDNYPINLTTEAYDPENPPAEADTVDTYRLYNRWTGEHLFTQSASERASLKAAGWTDEGKAWTSPSKSNAPVYRLFNPYTAEHLYTTSRVEKDTLSQGGWNYEGIAWYSDPAREGAVFRLYNPSATTFTHHFTADLKERDSLHRSGWRFEGVAWYSA